MARAAPFVAPLSLPAEVRLMQATADVLFALVALAACAVALWWASRLPMLAIQGLRVEGQVTRNSESTLRANTLHRLSGNFLTIDLQDCRTAFESVPWVRRAEVRRIWPLRLSVQLEEHQPVALWTGADGNDRLVNSFGEVFEANVGDVEDDDLPAVTTRSNKRSSFATTESVSSSTSSPGRTTQESWCLKAITSKTTSSEVGAI